MPTIHPDTIMKAEEYQVGQRVKFAWDSTPCMETWVGEVTEVVIDGRHGYLTLRVAGVDGNGEDFTDKMSVEAFEVYAIVDRPTGLNALGAWLES